MFRLTIDHRVARKATNPGDVFDLGAGGKNCIDCAGRSGPKDELGYCCAIFVDAVTGAHLPAVDLRSDEALCGLAARGFADAAGESKTMVQVAPLPDWDPRDHPLEIEPLITDEPIVADLSGSGGACADCAHSFRATFCARVVALETGQPIPVVDVRADAGLCGPDGAWFEEAPPMTPEEELILAQGGSTYFHW
jgi:hypothetical protein